MTLFSSSSIPFPTKKMRHSLMNLGNFSGVPSKIEGSAILIFGACAAMFIAVLGGGIGFGFGGGGGLGNGGSGGGGWFE